jgi:drug/metabolite transporter (DMT)-like permease
MKIGRIPIKIFLLIIFLDVLDTAAQLLMKKGIGHLDNIYFWMGLFIYISTFFLWMRILSKVDLSIALPIASVGYMLIPIASVVFLNEQVSLVRWMGIFLIVVGVYFVSKSKSQETK